MLIVTVGSSVSRRRALFRRCHRARGISTEQHQHTNTPLLRALHAIPGALPCNGVRAVLLRATVAVQVPVGVADSIPPHLHHEDVRFTLEYTHTCDPGWVV